MASQAVYCLSLQIRPPADENKSDGQGNDPSRSNADKMQSDSGELTTPATSATITSQIQQPQHSNIYLVRGARTENGHLILQNSHELLSLLNDDDKSIILQHPRIQTNKSGNDGGVGGGGSSGVGGGTILFHQPTLKATTTDSPILLQTQTIKKTSTPGEGSIILQQRLNKTGGTDGPILLQTLKRLDKSQPILFFRSANTTTTTATTTIAQQHQQQQQQQQHKKQQLLRQQQQGIVVKSEDCGDERTEPQPQKQANIPLGSDGEPIKLPENLESLPRADHFPIQRHRWNTNEEIAAILISFDKHSEWQSKEVKTRPKSGSMLLYSRKKVRYRRDGYCWKKRKDGKTTREDHMKLKVQGTECIYGCYVHSAILPTFHRRCYWLLQNPDIVLVHYLNVPYPDDNKMAVITPSLSLWGDKKEWTKEELFSQLKPMFFSEDEPDASNEIEISTAETVEALVQQLMEKQRSARQAALVKQLECGCPDSTCADGKSCSHPMRRITAGKTSTDKRNENNNQVSSTTPNVLIGQRVVYPPRWVSDRRGGRGGIAAVSVANDHNIQDLSHSTATSAASALNQTTVTTTPKLQSLDNSIHFQVIPTSQHSNISNQTPNSRSNANNNNNNNNQTSNNSSSNVTTQNLNNIQPTNTAQQQLVNNHHQQNNQQLIRNSTNNNGISVGGGIGNNQLTAVVSHSNQNSLVVGGGGDNNHQHQQQQLHQQQHLINTTNRMTVNSSNASIVTSAPPLVLSLSQIQGHGSLLILNGGQQQSFVCQTQQQQQQQSQHHQNQHQIHQHNLHQQQQQQQHHQQQQQLNQQQQQQQQRRNHSNNKDDNKIIMNNNSNQQQPSHLMASNTTTSTATTLVPKQEAMDSSSSSSDKHLDNVYDSMSYSSTQQNTPIDSPLKENNVKDFHDSLQFFNETLDLSQEDIQKTLSANMPIGGNHLNQHTNHHQVVDDTIPGDINPMDFIDNCDVVGVENVHGHEDDFVNLDAFDMLVEFPELDALESMKNGFLQNSMDGHDQQGMKKSGDTSAINMVATNEMYNITDYSPEWAYPEGGVKVLVTGPWNANSSYTVLFDSFPVPTTIVQSGVLRCYCPAHEVGLATLQVACDGFVISNSVIFEYKSPQKTENSSEGNTNDALFKFSLIDRFENINDRLQIKTEPGETSEETALFNQPNFEDRLVTFCNSLSIKTWKQGVINSWPSTHRGMTLLHFASALGYSKLVCAMLTWRSENSSTFLETEIDALSQDIEGYTPLMWACARGHIDTAIVLCRWNSNALNMKNNFHQNPIDVAKKYGFSSLINEIEKFFDQQSKTTGNGNQLLAAFNEATLNANNFKINPYTYENTNNYFVTNNNNINNNNVNLNCSSTSKSVFSTVSSALSMTSTSNVINTNSNNLNSNSNNNNTNNNINLNSNMNRLSQCSSPGSIGSMNTNRSHDGVFLRPDAVTSASSPPGARLSKRPSVDSGINVDIRSTQTPARPTGKGVRETQQKSNRFDRSMSLPISNSPLSYNSLDNPNDSFSLSIDEPCSNHGNSFNSSSLSSPLRKMDFALCEVAAGESSPIGIHQSTSDDDDDRGQNGDIITGCGVVGESDAKVFTLAEQIIAAMPERIKNESEDMMSLGSPMQDTLSGDTSGMSGLNDSFMEPILDTHYDQEFHFEFSDNNYRYHDVGTPCSSLSPASSGPLQSPASYSIPQDPPMNSPSPPPTTQDFTEFLQASNSTPKPFEADFSNLTLTDREQRELYEAAKCIQKAYRSYKGRKKLEEQDKERTAAIVIQNYYRRYKQYVYTRQLTQAALVIQNKYRSYLNKRFKKSQTQGSPCQMSTNTTNSNTDPATSQFHTYYKNFQNEQQNQSATSSGTTSKEPSPSGPLKRTYSQRTQNQAARKIQQFMRQSKLKLQRERAEKERLVHQHRAEYLQSLQYPGHQEVLSRGPNEIVSTQSLHPHQNHHIQQQTNLLMHPHTLQHQPVQELYSSHPQHLENLNHDSDSKDLSTELHFWSK